jgi:hypothetical protein
MEYKRIIKDIQGLREALNFKKKVENEQMENFQVKYYD